MATNSELCTSFVKCLFDFQTGIAGVFAIFAAIYSAKVILRAAKLPIDAQNAHNKALEERKRSYIKQILAEDFRLLASRARQAEGTIKVHIAANKEVTERTKEKTTLKFHPIIDDWEFMSLLPLSIFNEIMALRRSVEDHNFDMERAGGVFGDDNFKKIITKRVQSIESHAMQLSNKVLS